MSFPNASCISLIKYLLFCHERHQVPSYELIKVKNYFVRRYVRYKMPYHDNFFFFISGPQWHGYTPSGIYPSYLGVQKQIGPVEV